MTPFDPCQLVPIREIRSPSFDNPLPGPQAWGMQIRIEPRGMMEVRRGRRVRLVPSFAVVVNGRELQPYLTRREAEAVVRKLRAEVRRP